MFSSDMVMSVLIIGGTAVTLLVAVAWTARSVIVQMINKRHDLFQQQLQMEVSRTLDQFRKSLAEEKIIFGATQDNRSDSLVQLYSIMIDIIKRCRELSRPGLNNFPFAVAIAQNFVDSIQDFFDVYQKNGIYFSDEFCSAMDAFMGEHEAVVTEMVAALDTRAGTQQEEQELLMALQRAWSRFEMRTPALISVMKTEFHRMIGGSSRWF